MKVEWERSVLPGCFGHPCEQLRRGKRVARVWQASPTTARGAWCWSIGSGRVHVTTGSRSKAKASAKRALTSRRSGVKSRGKPMERPNVRPIGPRATGAHPAPTITDSPTYRRLAPMLRELLGNEAVTEIEGQLNGLLAEPR